MNENYHKFLKKLWLGELKMKKINLILKIVLLSMLIVFSNFHYVRANENSNEQIKDGIYKIM